MKLKPKSILSITESVCPECLSKITARRVVHGNDVFLEKTCPEHGSFQTVIWRGEPAFASWVRPEDAGLPQPTHLPRSNRAAHMIAACVQNIASRLVVCFCEVTQRCDLGCPSVLCRIHPPSSYPIRAYDIIEGWYQRLLEAGGPFNIQLSGGEPCLRNDLTANHRPGEKPRVSHSFSSTPTVYAWRTDAAYLAIPE